MTPSRRQLLLAGAALVTGCAEAAPVARKPEPPAPLDSFLAAVMRAGAVPGMALAVVHRGEVVHASGLGFADREAGRRVEADTPFYIASTTKALTALTAALLHHRKAIDLDAKLSAYLPKLSLAEPLSPDAITLRNLLGMTHGISNDGPVVFRTAYSGEGTRAELLALLRHHKPAKNGRAFEYGNIGYNLLGFALEERLGRSWKDLVEAEVLTPLGMRSTTAWASRVDRARVAMPYEATGAGFERVPFGKADGNMHAAGGHFSTVVDLAKLAAVELDSGRLAGRDVLPSEVLRETTRQHAPQDRAFGPFQRHGWGLGWDLGTYEGEPLVHRFGSFRGSRCHLSFMPERRVGVAVLTNGGALSSPFVDLVATYVYEQIGGPGRSPKSGEPATLEAKFAKRLADLEGAVGKQREAIGKHRAERRARARPLLHPLSGYEGTYESAVWGRMNVRASGGGLVVTMGVAESPAEVYDAEKDQLRVELDGGGGILRFDFAAGASQARAVRFREAELARVSPTRTPG